LTSNIHGQTNNSLSMYTCVKQLVPLAYKQRTTKLIAHVYIW